MLRVQNPPSMPSAHLLERTNVNGILPPFLQRRDFDWDWSKVNAASRAGQKSHLPCSHYFPESVRGCEQPGSKSGLRTPPKDMNGMNGNPLAASNAERTQYKRVPVVASNAPPYQASLATLDNSKQVSNRQPFYNSYYSATRPQSPVPPKKDHVAQSEQTARRRASNDSNSIASHLQIPSSINESKGSLPEFAAQVRRPTQDVEAFVLTVPRSPAFSGLSPILPFVWSKMHHMSLCHQLHSSRKQCLQQVFENG